MAWNDMYERAKLYYEDHGNLDIPISYVCEDGIKLGVWLNTQRAVKNGIRPGIMDGVRKQLLDDLEIDWYPNETAWNNGYKELCVYKEQYGDINVPLRYVSESGFSIGLWLQNQRRAYLKKGQGALDQVKIDKLNKLGIIWEPHVDQWERNYSLLQSYYEEHGNVDLPNGYSISGVNIAAWLDTQRQTYNGFGKGVITKYQIAKLEKLGVDWGNKLDSRWEEMFQCAKEYYDKFGHLVMLMSYISDDGRKLGSWLFGQRIQHRDGKLDKVRVQKLNTIGMVWDYQSPQQTSFFEQAICFYFSQYFEGVKSRDKSLGFELDVYVPRMKVAVEYDGQFFHNHNKAQSDERKNQLCEEYGIELYRIREKECIPLNNEKNSFYLKDNSIRDFEEVLGSVLKQLGITNPDININRDSGNIYAQYVLVNLPTKPPVRSTGKRESNDIQFLVSLEWYEYYNVAKEFYEEYGHLLVSRNAMYYDVDLGKWIFNQRHYYNDKKYVYPTQKVELLEDIGMVWDSNEYKWEQGFQYAKEYYLQHGDLIVPSNYVVDGFSLGHWILNQRSKYTGKYATSGKITKNQISKLESIGMVWNSLEYKWNKLYLLAKKYYEEHGDLLIPYNLCVDGEKLGQWISSQREYYRNKSNSEFTIKRIQLLEKIGMVWEVGRGNGKPQNLDSEWIAKMEIIESLLKDNPKMQITKRYVTEDGVQIGSWLYRQKRIFCGAVKGTLEEWQIKRLKDAKLLL